MNPDWLPDTDCTPRGTVYLHNTIPTRDERKKEEEQVKEEGRDEGKNPMHVSEEGWFVWKELNDLDEEDSSPSTFHSFSHLLQKQKDHYSLGNEYCS